MPHPGRILLEEYLESCQISQNELARQMGVAPRRVNEIVLGKRAITADTALRLAQIFGLSAKYWMGLQVDYDLDQARLAPARRDRFKGLPAPKRGYDERRHDAFRFKLDY